MKDIATNNEELFNHLSESIAKAMDYFSHSIQQENELLTSLSMKRNHSLLEFYVQEELITKLMINAPMQTLYFLEQSGKGTLYRTIKHPTKDLQHAFQLLKKCIKDKQMRAVAP